MAALTYGDDRGTYAYAEARLLVRYGVVQSTDVYFNFRYDSDFYPPVVLSKKEQRKLELRAWSHRAIKLRRRLERAIKPRPPLVRAVPILPKHPTNSAERYRVTP